MESVEYDNFKAIKIIGIIKNKENWVGLAFCLMFIFFFILYSYPNIIIFNNLS